MTQGAKSLYARDDSHREALLEEEFKGRGKVEISRFKGLGEMPPAQLKTTTMAPESRTLLRIVVAEDDRRAADDRVEALMGRHPEKRLAFIQEHAASVENLDV